MIVVVKGGVAHCTCNGEVLEAALKVPATGPIGLEGDRGQWNTAAFESAKTSSVELLDELTETVLVPI